MERYSKLNWRSLFVSWKLLISKSLMQMLIILYNNLHYLPEYVQPLSTQYWKFDLLQYIQSNFLFQSNPSINFSYPPPKLLVMWYIVHNMADEPQLQLTFFTGTDSYSQLFPFTVNFFHLQSTFSIYSWSFSQVMTVKANFFHLQSLVNPGFGQGRLQKFCQRIYWCSKAK